MGREAGMGTRKDKGRERFFHRGFPSVCRSYEVFCVRCQFLSVIGVRCAGQRSGSGAALFRRAAVQTIDVAALIELADETHIDEVLRLG